MISLKNTNSIYGRGVVKSLPLDEFAFYSDGEISGGQLLDKSGNLRHATVTNNLITDPGFESGSTLIAWNGATGIINSTEQAHSGTKSCKFSMTGISSLKGVRYQYFKTKPGEVVNWSFWVYKTVGTTIAIQVLAGNGSTVAFQNTAANPTLNTWVQYSGSFTDTAGGAFGEVRFYYQSGDLTIYTDDISVTITGKPEVACIMSNDATLKSIDTKNNFFTSGGIPITNRTDIGDPTIENDQIYCGGEKKYIFTKTQPNVTTWYLLNKLFISHDWEFDSCEKVLTVGSGKTYATVQAAVAAVTGQSKNNRFRIDIYDNMYANVAADYATTYSGSYKDLIVIGVPYVYLNGVGDVSIIGTLPETASDNDMQYLCLVDQLYTGGFRNIKFHKTNGRYTMHADSASFVGQFFKYYKCEFHNYGMDSVVAYRNANTLPLPYANTGGVAALGMGDFSAERFDLVECTFSGIIPVTNHGGHASGSESYFRLYKCVLTSLPIYNPTYNPLSELQISLRLDTTPGGGAVKSNAFLVKNTLNNGYSSDSSWIVSTK